MARKKSALDFEGMIGKGENPKGFTAQTANGTSKAQGSGWNKGWNYEQPEVAPDGPWNGNRTGE